MKEVTLSGICPNDPYSVPPQTMPGTAYQYDPNLNLQILLSYPTQKRNGFVTFVPYRSLKIKTKGLYS